MVFTSFIATLVLIPVAAAYVLIIARINREVVVDREKYQAYSKTFRINGNAAIKLAATGSPSQLTTARLENEATNPALEAMSGVLFKRRSVESKLKNINSGVFFTGVVLLLGYLALQGTDSGLSITRLVAYFVVLHVAFRALNTVVSTLAVVSRLSTDIDPLMQLTEFRRSCTLGSESDRDAQATRPDPIRELALRSRDLGFGGKSELRLPQGQPIAILREEEVNRLTLPGSCFLLEEITGVKHFQLFDYSVFTYGDDSSTPMPARPLVFSTSLEEIGDILRNRGSPTIDPRRQWFFWVTDDLDKLLAAQAGNQALADDTVCLVIIDGHLRVVGDLVTIRGRASSIKKQIRKSRAREQTEEELDDEI
jgi:hypothetical protein